MIIGGVTLDNDLIWTDEFQFTSTAGTANRTIDGHMIVQVATTTGGQPMTLTGGADFGWQKRSTVLALQVLADWPEDTIEVTLPDGRVFQTQLRVEEQPCIAFTPVTTASAPGADFWYYGTVNLRIV